MYKICTFEKKNEVFRQTAVTYVKGVYYMRVAEPNVSYIPICNASNAGTVLSGSSAIKRMCRYVGTFSITRPFTGFSMGLGDTLSRYFRIDFSDTAFHEQFKDSLLSLFFVEDIQNLPVMKPFGNFSFPNDKYATQQWHLEKVKAYQAHDSSTGSGMIIAVVDDAFDMNHEDLKDNYYINTTEKNGITGVDDDANGYIDDISGWDASDADNDPNNYGTDQAHMKYHGTMVTGVISAKPNNLKGLASIAPNAKILPIKVSSDSFLYNPLTHTLEGLMYAIQSPAQIINLSWGGEMYHGDANSSVLHLLIQEAVHKGKIIVAAAGNGHSPQAGFTSCINNGRGKAMNNSYDSIRIFPAAFSEVFSVGATSSNDQKACFSDYGTMSYVDIMAPGENIYSTFPFNNYFLTSGTSFSAPLVAGICALVWSKSPLIIKEAVVTRIKNTADNISQVNENIATKIGAGRVNAFDAVMNNQVKAWFKVVGQQTGCEGTTFLFSAKSYPGYTYEWDFGDGSLPTIGTANQSWNATIPLSFEESLFNIKLTLKNGSGVIVSTFIREKYILVSKCSTNRINNVRNQWMFSYNCAVNFSEGIAKQDILSGPIPKNPGLINYTSLFRPTGGNIKYAAYVNSYGNNSLMYNNGSTMMSTLEIGYRGSSKFFTMHVPAFRNLQGEFFKLDTKRTVYISNYDTNINASNVGLRFSIIRDSTPGGFFSPYIKNLQRGIAIPGPDSMDKTSDGGFSGSPIIEHGMVFIPRCDTKYWMIVKGASGHYKDSLLVYQVDPGATGSNPIFSFVKAYHCPPLKTTDIIRANRYGTQIICASEKDSNLAIFDFKPTTGVLSLRHYFGLENRFKLAPVFNKTSNILYLVDYEGLKQINLDYKDPTKHIVKIYSDNYLKNKLDFWFGYDYGLARNPMYGIQIGPDGRIYTNFPSDMFPANRLGIVALPDKFFYNSYGNSWENYLPLGLKFNNYTGLSVSTYQGITEYQHASECKNLERKMFSQFIECNVVKLTTNSCNILKKWNYIYNGYPHSRYADEFLLYLDSFPSSGVTITLIDGLDTVIRSFQQPALPPGSLIASASSTCSREVPVNYKFTHSLLNQSDIFVKDWSVIGGEIFRYLGDSSVDVVWKGDGVIGTLRSVVMFPLSGCKDTIDFTILKKPPVKIKPFGLSTTIVDTAVINYNDIFYLTIADTGYLPIYTTYKWFKDGVKLNFSDTTKRILLIEPGKYWLVADGPCGPDTSNKVVIVLICDPNSYLNPTFSGLTLNATLTLEGQIDVTGPWPTTFENCTLFIKDCSHFEVEGSDTLLFLNTKIIGCGTWQGIRVIGQGLPRTGTNCGYLSMAQSSIENAIIGISAENGGEVHTNSTRFSNNEIHIAYDSYNTPNYATHIDNSFGPLKPNTSSCTHPLTLNLKETNPMVYMEGVQYIIFDMNRFEGANTFGVSNVSNIEAEQANNITIQHSDFYSETDFGIYTGNTGNSNISYNQFNDQNRYGLGLNTGRGITKTGLRAKGCNSLSIGPDNGYWFCDKGIEWYASSFNTQSDIFESNFSGCNNGVMFAQQVNPRTNTNTALNTDTTNQRQLLIKCNLFESDSIAIVGSGKLIDHGTPLFSIKNKFVNNINWDIAIKNHFNYNYSKFSSLYRPNDPLSNLLFNRVDLNNGQNIGYGGSGWFTGITCNNGLLVLKDSVNKDKRNLPFNVILFPNPVDRKFLTIQFTDIPNEKITLELYNSIGQKLQVKSIINKEDTLILEQFASGIYYIKIYNNNFRITHKLIIK